MQDYRVIVALFKQTRYYWCCHRRNVHLLLLRMFNWSKGFENRVYFTTGVNLHKQTKVFLRCKHCRNGFYQFVSGKNVVNALNRSCCILRLSNISVCGWDFTYCIFLCRRIGALIETQNELTSPRLRQHSFRKLHLPTRVAVIEQE